MAKRRAKAQKPARNVPKKRKAAPPVKAVRKDARGNFTDVATGKPVSAERARRFKTFYDSQGRRRSTKGGAFTGGKSIAPTRAAKKRRGLARAYKPSDERERAGRQETLRTKRRKGKVRPDLSKSKMRYTGKRRTRELAKKFGINLAKPNRSDFANLIETQGRELGRGSFFVADPVKSAGDLTILRGVEKATRAALRDVPSQTVAITVNVSSDKGELGSQTLIARSDERAEVVGGVMSTVFSVLGENGLDASDGPDGERADAEDFDPVFGLEVEVIAYELE